MTNRPTESTTDAGQSAEAKPKVSKKEQARLNQEKALLEAKRQKEALAQITREMRAGISGSSLFLWFLGLVALIPYSAISLA